MDLNKRIAERRAELQREQAAETERKKQEAREKAELYRAKERVVEELAEKEAESRIQLIQAKLQGYEEGVTRVEKILAISEEVTSDETQKLVNDETDRKVRKHIRELASQRMTSSENWSLGLLFLGGILGFFFAWWLGLGLWGWSAYYLLKVTDRHEKKIKSELGMD